MKMNHTNRHSLVINNDNLHNIILIQYVKSCHCQRSTFDDPGIVIHNILRGHCFDIDGLTLVEASDELLRIEVDDRGLKVRPLVGLAVALVRVANRLGLS